MIKDENSDQEDYRLGILTPTLQNVVILDSINEELVIFKDTVDENMVGYHDIVLSVYDEDGLRSDLTIAIQLICSTFSFEL